MIITSSGKLKKVTEMNQLAKTCAAKGLWASVASEGDEASRKHAVLWPTTLHYQGKSYTFKYTEIVLANVCTNTSTRPETWKVLYQAMDWAFSTYEEFCAMGLYPDTYTKKGYERVLVIKKNLERLLGADLAEFQTAYRATYEWMCGR